MEVLIMGFWNFVGGVAKGAAISILESNLNVDEVDYDYDNEEANDKDEEKIVYTTQTWNGYGKQNYYYNQYRQKGDKVTKYKVNRRKFFDGDENNWETEEREEQSWNINDESMPDWLKKRLDN